METLLHWDTAVLHWINDSWSNPVLDWLMPAMRNKFTWIPLYIFGLSWIFFNFNLRQSTWAIVFILLGIFASDTISSKLIKNQVHRARPCQVEHMDPPVVLRVKCGSGYSFTSSHAANHFCLAAFAVSVFGPMMGRWRHGWWIWATGISLAQVYVGVHYPLDILGGALLGTVLGMSMGTICNHQMKKAKSAEG